jgi:hypothetical protein
MTVKSEQKIGEEAVVAQHLPRGKKENSRDNWLPGHNTSHITTMQPALFNKQEY